MTIGIANANHTNADSANNANSANAKDVNTTANNVAANT